MSKQQSFRNSPRVIHPEDSTEKLQAIRSLLCEKQEATVSAWETLESDLPIQDENDPYYGGILKNIESESFDKYLSLDELQEITEELRGIVRGMEDIRFREINDLIDKFCEELNSLADQLDEICETIELACNHSDSIREDPTYNNYNARNIAENIDGLSEHLNYIINRIDTLGDHMPPTENLGEMYHESRNKS